MLGLIAVSPDPTALQLGPFSIGWYGIGYVVGLAVLVWVTQREIVRRGVDPRHVANCFLLVAALALVGGRLYHVIDEFDLYRDNLLAIVLPPYSGLGLYGGIAGALLGIYLYTRRHGIPFIRALDSVVPGTLLAQGIARWGNFFNQELYGPPTDLPWGITIECEHRIPAYPCESVGAGTAFPFESTGFHPLFFYESGLDVLGALIALTLSRRFFARLRDGDVASFWLIWYGSVRTILEVLRADYNWTIFGVPTAMLIGIAAILVGIALIVRRHRRPPPAATPLDPRSRDPEAEDPEPGPVPA